MTFPWQLYLFCLINVGAGIACCFNKTCDFAFGDCSRKDLVVFRCFAFCLIYVGVLYSVLTVINTNNAAKLKRLAMIATTSAVATLVVVIMMGPTKFGGVEKNWTHLSDVITFVILVILLTTAICDDSEVAGCSPLFQGLGVNPKTLLWLFVIGGIIKVVAFTDFVSYDFMTGHQTKDPLALMLWNAMAVLIVQIILALFFALGYGDYKDQETSVLTVVALSIVAMICLRGVSYKEGLFKMWIGSLIVLVVLTIAAVVGGRRERRRDSSGYEAVANV